MPDSEHVWRAKGYRGPLTVIPQVGVEPDVFKPLDNHSTGDGDQFRVGYAGRFVEEKGIDVLLNALHDLGGEWQADLAGSGPDQPRLAELAQRLQIAERVRFLPMDALRADRGFLSIAGCAGAPLVQSIELEGTVRACAGGCDGLRRARHRLDVRRDSQRHRRRRLDFP